MKLCQGNVNKSFEDNFCKMIRGKDMKEIHRNCVRYNINCTKKLRNNILQFLIRNNITRASLFPGIDGFASSLRAILSNPEIIIPEPSYSKLVGKTRE